jgi:tetratricopeptide (TPR) repeat protein
MTEFDETLSVARSGVTARVGGEARANVLGSGVQVNVETSPGAPPRVRIPVVVERVASAKVSSLPTLVGREGDLQQALSLLRPDGTGDRASIIVLTGLPGVGKTGLARQLACQAVDEGWFSGGSLFVDLHGYEDTDWAVGSLFGAMIRTLDLTVDQEILSPEEKAAVFHRHLSAYAARGKPVLLVFDNVASADQVEAAIPRQGLHRTLVISRHDLSDMDGAKIMRVGLLEPRHSIAMIDAALRARDPDDDRLASASEALELAMLCGNLPLALRIAAALLASDRLRPLADLVEEMQDARERLESLSYGSLAVRAAFELSYKRLPADEAKLFRLLPNDSGPQVSTEAAAELADCSVVAARRSLARLARASLVDRASLPDRWGMHDLIRLYALELGDAYAAEDRRDRCIARLLESYLSLALSADACLRGRPGSRYQYPAEALAWFHLERQNLIAAIGLAEIVGNARVVSLLPLAIAQYLNVGHHSTDFTHLTLTEFTTGAATLLAPDGEARGLYPFEQATVMEDLGVAFIENGYLDQALLSHRRAAELFRDQRDERGEARALNNLGLTLIEVGRMGEAESALRQAAELEERAGNWLAHASALISLSTALRGLQRIDESAATLEQAASSFERGNDVHGRLAALTNAGAALIEARRPADAIFILRRAVNGYDQLGARPEQAAALINLAIATRRAGNTADAVPILQRAVKLCKRGRHKHGLAAALSNLASCLRETGKRVDASSCIERAVSVYRELGDLQGLARSLTRLGRILGETGDRDRAVEALQEAIQLYTKTRDTQRRSGALTALSMLKAGPDDRLGSDDRPNVDPPGR